MKSNVYRDDATPNNNLAVDDKKVSAKKPAASKNNKEITASNQRRASCFLYKKFAAYIAESIRKI